MPEISVLMLAYNTEKYIDQAIRSILNQSFADFELLIYNDGSTDKTVQVIKSFSDKRIRFIDSKINRGLSYARMFSLKEARCKYVAILDSDDIAMPHRLKLQYEFMERNSFIALCGGNAIEIGENGELKEGLVHKKFKPHDLKILLFFYNIFINSSAMYRREIAVDLGGYNDMAPVEDYDLFVRIADKYDIHTFNEALVYYRIHCNNISKTKFDLAVRRLKEVKNQQLGMLGVDAGEFGDTFNALLSWKFEEFSVEKFFTLLLELKRKNRQYSKFPILSFEKKLYTYWYDLIMTKVGKRNALPYLRDRNLFRMRLLSWKQSRRIFKLILRSLIKK
jgi:glycosyltransferase involved in cell wall biosynthesis